MNKKKKTRTRKRTQRRSSSNDHRNDNDYAAAAASERTCPPFMIGLLSSRDVKTLRTVPVARVVQAHARAHPPNSFENGTGTKSFCCTGSHYRPIDAGRKRNIFSSFPPGSARWFTDCFVAPFTPTHLYSPTTWTATPNKRSNKLDGRVTNKTKRIDDDRSPL